MKKTILFPGKYIQGCGLLAEAGDYIKALGKRPIFVWGEHTRNAVHGTVLPSISSSGLEAFEIAFNGECTKKEAQRVMSEVVKNKADVIVGFGGGKAIDTAKAAAAYSKLPLVIIPTIASNDAPTSACTVWYNDDGECTGFDLWQSNPDVILVDTGIIAKAPARFFVAGMGDALATWPEANEAWKSHAVSCAGGVPTMTAMAMAKLCFDTIMEYGLEAKKAAEAYRVTDAFEKVVEANVLLSGVGWESGGLACAHAIANALPLFHETHGYLHGEKVAFGLVCQLCLGKDMSENEICRIVDFMVAVGLPVTFEDLNMAKVSADRIKEFSKLTTAKGSFVHNHPFTVTAEMVADAMVAADELGKKRKTNRVQL